MVILPSHVDLQYGVQLRQGSVFPHLNSPPYGRLNVPQRNLYMDTGPDFSPRLHLSHRQNAADGSFSNVQLTGDLGFGDTNPK
jgi:hypothetical protein